MMNKYISKKERESLTRKIYPMPDWIENTLKEKNLIESYQSRPAYQKNDYISWITRAKKDFTKKKRLKQMIDELESGNKYMKMDYSGV